MEFKTVFDEIYNDLYNSWKYKDQAFLEKQTELFKEAATLVTTKKDNLELHAAKITSAKMPSIITATTKDNEKLENEFIELSANFSIEAPLAYAIFFFNLGVQQSFFHRFTNKEFDLKTAVKNLKKSHDFFKQTNRIDRTSFVAYLVADVSQKMGQ